MIVVVDITVANCNIIRAAKPAAQFQNNPMPVNEVEKIIWWENVNTNRFNNRVYDKLKGKALRKAQRIINATDSLSMSAEYGSIVVSASDFIPLEDTTTAAAK
jgi:hypothetical protein